MEGAIPARRNGAWIVAGASSGEVWILSADDTDLSGFVDVELRTRDGRRFLATFGTIADVADAMTRWRETGECLGGRYFWLADLVIVDSADVATIVAAVDDMVATGELTRALSEVRDDEESPNDEPGP
jgi:hypothetical protein